MSIRLAALLLLTPLPAAAHPGHIGPEIGHSHYLAAAALLAAVVIATVRVAKVLRARRKPA